MKQGTRNNEPEATWEATWVAAVEADRKARLATEARAAAVAATEAAVEAVAAAEALAERAERADAERAAEEVSLKAGKDDLNSEGTKMKQWTLQSTLTGKYISELFTTDHGQMFQATQKDDAYSWDALSTIHILAKEVGCCIVVPLSPGREVSSHVY
jgi:hypothetical protein